MAKVISAAEQKAQAKVHQVLGIIMLIGLIIVFYFAVRFVMNWDFLIN